MSFAKYLLSMQESSNDNSEDLEKIDENAEEIVNESEVEDIEFPVDESGFDGFGVDKLKAPSAEGLEAGKAAMDQFVTASDGKDTDVDWSFHDSFPKDSSGFEKDANSEIPTEEVKVDPNTIPAVPEEKDQFSKPGEGEDVSDNAATPEELAKDDDDVPVEESFTGWNDLW